MPTSTIAAVRRGKTSIVIAVIAQSIDPCGAIDGSGIPGGWLGIIGGAPGGIGPGCGATIGG
jgi:hypothetical protein